MREIILRHTPIAFPFDPYDPELTYMDSIIQTLQEHANCALEAETGFGKSLCLFCATIGFEREYRCAMNLLTQLKDAESNGISLQQEVTNLCRASDKNEEELEEELKFARETSSLAKCLTSQHVISDPSPAPEIIFLSRTHSELQEANHCLHSLSFKDLTIAYLGSRDNLCLNEATKELAKVENISLSTVCKSMVKNRKCQFAIHDSDVETPDLEDVITRGLASHACPYYTSRGELSSNIILAPYESLLDETISDQLKNAIIIVDEAHNFESVFKEQVSARIVLEDISLGLKLLNIAKTVATELSISMSGKSAIIENQTIFSSQEAKNPASFFQTKACLIHEASQILERVKSNCNALLLHQSSDRVFQCEEIFDGIRFDGLLPEIKDLGAYCDYLIYNLQHDVKRFTSKASFLFDKVNPIWKEYQYELLPNLFELIMIGLRWEKHTERHSYCVFFEKVKECHHIAINCLDIRIAIDEIETLNPYSLILTSATLSPLDSFESETGLEFLIKQSLPGITRPGQVIVKAVDDDSAIGTFVNRNAAYFKLVCEYVSKCVQSSSRGGILVFLPSYQFMAELKHMYAGSTVFFEDDPSAMRRYRSILSERPVLFAVARGSFSEGIDFSDDLCRTVIVVSIPFADIKSRLLLEQRKWYDAQKKGLTGEAYYENMAFRTVNECIGRVIRHKDDYGAVILLDQRYLQRRNRLKLPRWIDEELRSVKLSEIKAEDEDIETVPAEPKLLSMHRSLATSDTNITFTGGKPLIDEIERKKLSTDNEKQFRELILEIKRLGAYDELKQASKLARSNVVEAAMCFVDIIEKLSNNLNEGQQYTFLANLESDVLEEVIARL